MKKELFRQMLHLLFGCITILILVNFGIMFSLLFSSLGLLIGSIVSFLLKQGKHFPVIDFFLEQAEREQEKHFPGKGAITLFIGKILTHIIFFDNPTIVWKIQTDWKKNFGRKLCRIHCFLHLPFINF